MKKNSLTGQGKCPALLSRAEVAKRIGVCSHTIQRLTRKGELPAIIFSRRLVRYSPEVLEEFIRASTARKT